MINVACGGDFKVIRNALDCLDIVPSLLPCNEFVGMISGCGLCDLLFIGSSSTWCRPTPPSILKSLDRVLVNFSWNSLLYATAVEHLHRALFDYSPLLISVIFLNSPKAYGFCFQYMWTSDHSFLNTVHSSWQHQWYGDSC